MAHSKVYKKMERPSVCILLVKNLTLENELEQVIHSINALEDDFYIERNGPLESNLFI